MRTGQRKLCDVFNAWPDAHEQRQRIESCLRAEAIPFATAHHGPWRYRSWAPAPAAEQAAGFIRFHVSVQDIERALAALPLRVPGVPASSNRKEPS